MRRPENGITTASFYCVSARLTREDLRSNDENPLLIMSLTHGLVSELVVCDLDSVNIPNWDNQLTSKVVVTFKVKDQVSSKAVRIESSLSNTLDLFWHPVTVDDVQNHATLRTNLGALTNEAFCSFTLIRSRLIRRIRTSTVGARW